MIVRSIEVRNFKAFDGDHRLDLPDAGSRNVYLVGALNGAGKTSLVQALLLALYGAGAAGMPGLFAAGRDHRRRYEAWLANAWNRVARIRHDDAMIVRVVIASRGERFDVSRSYWFSSDGALEDEELTLVITDETGSGETLHADLAADRVVSIIPRHLAELTFFDGERVRPIDRDDAGPWLVEALDRLLDLEPIKRARLDLARLCREKRSLLADDTQRRAQESLQDQVDAAATALRRAEHGQDVLRERVLEARAELTRLDEHVAASLSGGSAVSVAQIEAEASALVARREELRSRFGRYMGDWLYLDLVSDLVSDVGRAATDIRDVRKSRDRRHADALAARAFLDRVLKDKMLRALMPDADAQKVWRERTRQLLPKTDAQPPIVPEEVWARNLTDAELDDVIGATDQASIRSHAEAQDVAADLQQVEMRLDQLEQLRARFDATTGLEANLRRRDELSNLSMSLQHELTRSSDKSAELRQSLARLKAHLSNLDSTLSDADDAALWLRDADRLGRALDAYVHERRASALGRLADGVLAYLRPLLRKQLLVTSVAVDPTSFEITLRDAAGQPLRLPSAGEQQLAALAFAAAMLDLADEQLPLFVDTPLARLDGGHRRNLVRHLLPGQKRQVIVLSTDEEIDTELLTLLEPAVAETYLLEYDEASATTTVVPGAYLDLGGTTADVVGGSYG